MKCRGWISLEARNMFRKCWKIFIVVEMTLRDCSTFLLFNVVQRMSSVLIKIKLKGLLLEKMSIVFWWSSKLLIIKVESFVMRKIKRFARKLKH